MKVLCPHASKCWKGGGSYKCAYNPPFCEKPLIPKQPEKVKEPEHEPIEKKAGNLEATKQPMVQKASKQSGEAG